MEQGGHELGLLVDVVVAPNGALADLVVEASGAELRVPRNGTLRFAVDRVSVA